MSDPIDLDVLRERLAAAEADPHTRPIKALIEWMANHSRSLRMLADDEAKSSLEDRQARAPMRRLAADELWKMAAEAQAALDWHAHAPSALAAAREQGARSRDAELAATTKAAAETWAAECERANRAEAENECLRAGLSIIAQLRHISGNAQPAFRNLVRMADAVLEGADLRDVETIEAIAAGRWRAQKGAKP